MEIHSKHIPKTQEKINDDSLDDYLKAKDKEQEVEQSNKGQKLGRTGIRSTWSSISR
jgi:hypothetical protein